MNDTGIKNNMNNKIGQQDDFCCLFICASVRESGFPDSLLFKHYCKKVIWIGEK